LSFQRRKDAGQRFKPGAADKENPTAAALLDSDKDGQTITERQPPVLPGLDPRKRTALKVSLIFWRIEPPEFAERRQL
jgi:hypothetical protein